jgi:hypothetical protein
MQDLSVVLYWRIQRCRRELQRLQALQWTAGYSEVRVNQISELTRVINQLTR